MNATLIKALVVLVPGLVLLIRSIAVFRRDQTNYPLLQVLGAGSLVVVVLTHIFEALHAFPSMGWGQKDSVGHYIDLCSAVLALTLFPTGYLLDALKMRRARRTFCRTNEDEPCALGYPAFDAFYDLKDFVKKHGFENRIKNMIGIGSLVSTAAQKQS